MFRPQHAMIAIALSSILASCASSPVVGDPSFRSNRTATAYPVPIDIESDLIRVYGKRPKGQEEDATTESGQGEKVGEQKSDEAVTVKTKSKRTQRNPANQSLSGSSEEILYVVKARDTLMKIAFSVLGDLTRWREIYTLNKSKIGKYSRLAKGMVLKISKSNVIDVDKNGNPYLIKRRDTLWKISDHLYGTPRKWWSLWDNNKQLIHDPNRIYAGFTLYYLTDPGSRLISEKTSPAPERSPASAEPTSAVTPEPITPDTVLQTAPQN